MTAAPTRTRRDRHAGHLPDTVLPPGVRQRARRLLDDAAALVGQLAGDDRRWQIDDGLLDAHLVLPWVIAAANGLPQPDAAPPPLAAPGGGWVAVDLGPDDADTFRTFCEVLEQEQAGGGTAADAEEFARRAQQWRLAVTPYRLNGPQHRHRPLAAAATPAASRTSAALGTPAALCTPGASAARSGASAPLAGVRVVDLTAMWAGPFATWLLGHLGAEVTKIEPACRPDGLRRGLRPPSAGPGPGAMFVALDTGKQHLGYDLRHPEDRGHFRELVERADVVIDSFSPRVRPNLGIDAGTLARWNGGLVDLSITAFAPGTAESWWVAYGGGVHATSGLAVGHGPTPCFSPAVVTYADPLSGLEALVSVLGALAGRRGANPAGVRLSVSLQDSLAAVERPTPTGPRDERDERDERDASLAGPVDEGLRAALGAWAAQAAETMTVLQDGCRVVPPPLHRPGRPAGAGEFDR